MTNTHQPARLENVKELENKLKSLPTTPGVYFHKAAGGEILYVGKAASLRNRVRQYFQKSRPADPKTALLVKEINDIDWIEVETEADALFLEAEMVRRYMPRYNILLRDDKSMQYVRIDYKSDYPTVQLVRRPLDDNAYYFGPYVSGVPVKKALRCLRKAFPYAVSRPVNQKRVSLEYHLGLDPGLEEGRTSLADYRANLKKLMQYLKGGRLALTKQIEKEMKTAARAQDYEKAAALRNQLFSMQELSRQVLFSDREQQDISKDHALQELAALLCLEQAPRRIEGFDISHIQGTHNAASMVVFVNGVPEKTAYRKFKMRSGGNDDFSHIKEAISRRLREDNIIKWGTADLILIDGGRGQLQAGIDAREQVNTAIPVIGLAKREEEIIIHTNKSLPGKDIENVIKKARLCGAYVNQGGQFVSLTLPKSSNTVKLLQRIRDESHRFAVSYHSTLRSRGQTASILDTVPGVGPATRKKLIRKFGSVRGVSAASPSELAELVGAKKASIIQSHLADFGRSGV